MVLLSPLYLIGLIAVGIPIAIHLFNLRRYRVIYFSNVDQLQELQQETRKQSRLRELLILAARVLAVVFLVLAFAQPVIPHKNSVLTKGEKAVSVYVDNSFSMENADGEETMLDLAVRKAREIASAYGPDDQYQLLTNDMAGSQFRWLSKEEFLAALEAVAVSPASPMLSSVAQRQQDFLRTMPGADKMAYLISDFQQSSADFAAFPHDSTIHSALVPLVARQTDNLYLDTLMLNAPAYYPGNTATVTVRLRNVGTTRLEDVPLRLYVNGKERTMTTATLEPGGDASAVMSFAVDQVGQLNGSVVATDFPVCFDDTLFFSINVRERIRVLEVDGAEPNSALRKLFANDSSVDFRSLSIKSLDYSLLDGQNMIVLNEVGDLPSGLVQTLLDFAEMGGSLVVVPSDKGDLSGLNALLSAFHAPTLKPYKGTKAKVGKVNFDNALFRNVFDSKVDNMETPSVEGYCPFESTGGTVCESLMRFVSGSDYLAVTQIGAGKLYLFAAPLRGESTDFVHQALFVPTLFNMALFTLPAGAPYALLGADEPVMLSMAAAEVCHLRNEEGTVDFIPDIRRMNGRSHLFVHSDPRTAGFYTLTSNQDREGLAFNYSRRESVMEFYAPAELRRLLKDNGMDCIEVASNQQKSMEDYIRAQHDGTPLWRWCLLLALLFLGSEIALIRTRRQ